MKPAHIIAKCILVVAFSLPSALLAQATPVSTATVAKGLIEQHYQGLARVRPLLETHAAGQFDGRIVEILARVGQPVTAGQPLARLNSKAVELGTSSLVLGGAGYMVVANIDGVIVAQAHSIGDVISAGTPIFTIVPKIGLRATLSVPLEYAGDITYDSQATLQVSNGDISTTPSSIQPFDLADTGYFPVEFALTKGAPVIGSVISADIVVRRNDAALILPSQAIVEKDGGFYVFVVKGGKAVETAVNLGIRTPSTVEILSGVVEGNEVVISGNYVLEDGAKVTVTTGG